MTTVSKTFTVAAVSEVLALQPGQTATYSAIVAALETFSGWALLQRSRSAQSAWDTLVELDGRVVPIDPSTTDGTLVNETTAVEYYRWQNLEDSADDGLAVEIADVVDVEERKVTKAGATVYTINDDGSITFTSIANLATLVAAVLEGVVGDLPTADPAVIGALWLDGGVLTVSAGP